MPFHFCVDIEEWNKSKKELSKESVKTIRTREFHFLRFTSAIPASQVSILPFVWVWIWPARLSLGRRPPDRESKSAFALQIKESLNLARKFLSVNMKFALLIYEWIRIWNRALVESGMEDEGLKTLIYFYWSLLTRKTFKSEVSNSGEEDGLIYFCEGSNQGSR